MKGWFKKQSEKSAKKKGPPEQSIDDLIVLGEYEEAERRLGERLRRSPRDLHARTRLAEVLVQQRRGSDAVKEYVLTAEAYAEDGFLDKAGALLATAGKLSPGNDTVRVRTERLQRRRRLARTRTKAVAALKEASKTATGRYATAAIELEQIWDRLAETDLVDKIPAEQIVKLLGEVKIHRVAIGQTLAGEGEEKPVLYVISGGDVEAVVERGGNELALRSFASGDIIGERALFRHEPWPATFRVTRPSSVLELSREGLERLLVGNPDPKGLLDALRSQGHGTALLQAMRQIKSEQ